MKIYSTIHDSHLTLHSFLNYISLTKEQFYNYWGILISLQCISLLVSTSEVGDDYLTLLRRGKLLIADPAVDKISIVSIDSVCGLKLL